MKFLKRSLEKRESTFDDIRALERRVNVLIVLVLVQIIVIFLD
jgi:hypothetical protein